ncbi:MAG: hypothetical protein HN348_00730 [Proteobacteria bacterium]|nr:hypothetical protein [Pseudomonadota bacterium]
MRLLPFFFLAIVGHLVALFLFDQALPYLLPPPGETTRAVSLLIIEPSKINEEEEEPKKPDLEGQLVDIAPPEIEEVPKEADYLSDYNEVVPEETRPEKYKINPEILSRLYSEDEKMEMEDLIDLHVDKPSTGAKTGNDRFDPDEHGTLAALPNRSAKTNKEGIADPVMAAHKSSERAGAPQNDWLEEERSQELALTSKKYLYNGYIQRIRRLVNFYWQQNLDNLPSSARLNKSHYVTEVNAILDGDGNLEIIEVVDESGSSELDDAVVRAFRLAGPFRNPPEGLIEKDGRVYLPYMDYRVNIGTARAHYQGIDPRAGVQFPGILKSPR